MKRPIRWIAPHAFAGLACIAASVALLPCAFAQARPALDPYAPEAGPLTLLVCAPYGITVSTFNSNDTVLRAPVQQLSIDNGAKSELKCATATCKLQVGSWAPTLPLSGYQVYTAAGVKPTNAATMAKGCSAYQ